jgi:tRNA-dihydrouridine synthase A
MSDIQNNVIKEIHPRISVAPMMDWTSEILLIK